MQAPASAGATILFVVPRFHNNLYFATKALVEAGYRVAVLAGTTSSKETHSHVVPEVPGDAAAIAGAVGRIAPDLVLIRRVKPLSDIVARLCRQNRIRAVAYDLAPADRRRRWVRRLVERVRGLPAERVTPVPPRPGRVPAPDATLLTFPIERIGPLRSMEESAGALRLLCVAKLGDAKKNQPWLIETIRAAGLSERVRLTLAGSTTKGGGRRQVRKLRAEASQAGWIDVLEDVPFAQMPDLYRRHDVCILPSAYEIYGVAPLEAMAYGTVPMISRNAGSCGYVTHGRDGYVVDPRRPDHTADLLRGLADDADLLRRMSEEAARTAARDLSPERFLAQFESLLHRA